MFLTAAFVYVHSDSIDGTLNARTLLIRPGFKL